MDTESEYEAIFSLLVYYFTQYAFSRFCFKSGRNVSKYVVISTKAYESKEGT